MKNYLLVVLLSSALLVTGCQQTDLTPAEEPPTSEGSNGEPEGENLPTESPEEWAKVVAVYEKDGRIMLIEGDSPPQALTEGPRDANPQFSPDGSMVLFERHPGGPDYWQTSYDLWVVNLDGSESPLVTQETLRDLAGYSEGEGPAQLLANAASWIENGSIIAFRTRYIVEVNDLISNDLWLADLESGEIVSLLPEDMGGTYAFSPDGSRLLVANYESVFIMDVDGTNRQKLIDFPRIYDYEGLYSPLPSWAPDGTYALVAIPFVNAFFEELQDETTRELKNATIWKLYPDGQAEELTTIYWPGMLEFYNGLIFSPDKRYLLNTVAQDNQFISQIVTIEGEVVSSFDQATEILGWSTDSSTIIAYTDKLVLVDTKGSQKPIKFFEDEVAPV